MTLKGIDISNWQAGINLPAVFPKIDFVICKATEGIGFVDKHCDKFIQQCIKNDKLWGFYHFGRNNDATKEAKYFIANCKNYFNKGIPVLDWEDGQSVSWVNEFVRYVHDKTGVWCWIYANPWRFNQGGVEKNCGRWIAQYPNVKSPSINYKLPDTPKTDGLVACWQYCSDGKLSGYKGNLDFNRFFGDKEAWLKYAKVESNSNASNNNNSSKLDISKLENDDYIVTIERK